MEKEAGCHRLLPGPGRTELLAPARDLACGRAAVDCGADAVYIGAPLFGAREAAGNSLDDIAALAGHAHRYWVRVYAALNTLLTDEELPRAVELAHRLHQAGVDGLIIQDLGLLACGLPPLPLIASTQMHNATPARVAFLARAGFSRAILARELSLAEIRAVRAATIDSGGDIELECFVHGALCASCSGRCYLSIALGGRSGNRGRCAQPCRRAWRAEDRAGRTMAEGHLLSLRDLGLWRRLGDLLDAGVTSFKIEGRLKDASYVANLTAFYRARLDEALRERGLRRSSSGESSPGFTPDPGKTFNRGFTEYLLDGVPPRESITTFATPKMTGEEVGRVVGRESGGGGVVLDREADLRPGDGVAWFDGAGTLTGSTVNAARGRVLVTDRAAGLAPGRVLYRNRDLAFLKELASTRSERRIAADLVFSAGAGEVVLAATDEDGVSASAAAPWSGEAARDPAEALAAAARQLARTGDSPFAARSVEPAFPSGAVVPFLPLSALNALRREALALLAGARERARPRPRRAQAVPGDARMAEPEADYSLNVLNRAAEEFHRRHGAEVRERAAESGIPLAGRRVMICRWCLRRELGLCPGRGGGKAEDLYLVDDEGRRLVLVFDCDVCRVEVRFAVPPAPPLPRRRGGPPAGGRRS